jgi:hypothetical protein
MKTPAGKHNFQGNKTMVAYMLAIVTVRDPAAYEEY